MRILSEADILKLVDRAEAVGLANEAFRRHAAGQGTSARAALWRASPKSGALLLAGADGAVLSLKSNVHTEAESLGAPRHWGSLLTVWDFATARPIALLSARAFNDHRTAAGFAAASFLAPPGARTLVVFGAGKSAPEAIRYLVSVLPGLERLILVGRTPERVAALALAARGWPECAHLAIETGREAGEAAAEADVIVTVTTATAPVFPGERVRPGALVILAGANKPDAREADDALMRRAIVLMDSREACLDKAGDIRLARASGALADERILGEIGAFTASPPRPAGADVTVFKSTGLPLQDLLLAQRLAAKAERLGLGLVVDLEGRGGA